LNCGVSTFDSTALTFGNWCGQVQPTPVALAQSNGPDAVVLPLAALQVANGASLVVTGSRPVIFAVYGDVTVAGTVDASASDTTPGAGGDQNCGTRQGGDGSGDTKRFSGASGGGGGGLGTAGGAAGEGNTDGMHIAGGIAGVAGATATLVPLIGGCAGGMAGGCTTAGGAGGGAVQISVAGSLTVTGTVRANGADGALPCGPMDEGGGTGGGSGGAILLEASTVQTSGATLQANGGDGGANGSFAGVYKCGSSKGGAGSTSASSAGTVGTSCQGGSSGGGGGYGRVVVNDR
jgi:hypothetical protein